MSCPRTSPTAGRFDGVTAVLPGIDLEGMAERAALMTRTDRKYLVPAGLAAELVPDLAGDLPVLHIDRSAPSPIDPCTTTPRNCSPTAPPPPGVGAASRCADANTWMPAPRSSRSRPAPGEGTRKRCVRRGPGPAGSCPGPAMAPCR